MRTCPYCHKPLNKNVKYYELQTLSFDGHIGYRSYYTSVDLERKDIKQYIENLKNDEYMERYVHLKEINESEYLKYKES